MKKLHETRGEDAYKEQERRITEFVTAEIKERQRVQEVAIESGRALLERLDIFRQFDAQFGQQGPDEVGRALEAARELVNIQQRLGNRPIDLGFSQFRDLIDIDALIPSGDAASIFRVWDEYRRLAYQAQRDVEDRIGTGTQKLAEQIEKDMTDASTRGLCQRKTR